MLLFRPLYIKLTLMKDIALKCIIPPIKLYTIVPLKA